MADLSARISQALAESRDFDVAQLNCEHYWDDTDGPCPLCQPSSFSELGNGSSSSADHRDSSSPNHEESSASSNYEDDSAMNDQARAVPEAEPEARQEPEPLPPPPPPAPQWPHVRPRPRPPPAFHVQEFNAYMEPQPGRRPRPLSPAERLSRKRKRGKVCDTCRARKERCPHVAQGYLWARYSSNSSAGLIRWLVHLLCIWSLCPRVDALFISKDFGTLPSYPTLYLGNFINIMEALAYGIDQRETWSYSIRLVTVRVLEPEDTTLALAPTWIGTPLVEHQDRMETPLAEHPDLGPFKPLDNVSAPTIRRQKLLVFTSRGRGSAWQTMRYHGHRLGPIDHVPSKALRTPMQAAVSSCIMSSSIDACQHETCAFERYESIPD